MKTLICVMVLIAGCRSPFEVEAGYKLEQTAWMQHAKNNTRILNTAIEIWEAAREKNIEFAIEKSYRDASIIVQQPRAKIVDGKPVGPIEVTMTTSQAITLSKIVSRHIVKSFKDTQSVKERLSLAIQKNDINLAQAAKLHAGISEWLQAGIDETVLVEISKDLLADLKPGD